MLIIRDYKEILKYPVNYISPFVGKNMVQEVSAFFTETSSITFSEFLTFTNEFVFPRMFGNRTFQNF